MDKKIVIIPTYNEKENIEKIIRVVFGLEGEYHILVIEDGSPDGTAAIVKRLQQEFTDRLHMIERKVSEIRSYWLGQKLSTGKCLFSSQLSSPPTLFFSFPYLSPFPSSYTCTHTFV